MHHVIGILVALVAFIAFFGLIIFIIMKHHKYSVAKLDEWMQKHNFVVDDKDAPGLFTWEKHPQSAGRFRGRQEKLGYTGNVDGVDLFMQSEFRGMRHRQNGERSTSTTSNTYEFWEPVLYFNTSLKHVDRVELDHTGALEISLNVPDLPKIGDYDLNDHKLLNSLDSKNKSGRELARWKSNAIAYKWVFKTWGPTTDWADWFYNRGIIANIMNSQPIYPFTFGFIEDKFYIRFGNLDHSFATYDQMILLGVNVVKHVNELNFNDSKQ